MKKLLSAVFAAAPLAVGLFRALGPHHDLRFLAMAVVALLVATLFLSVGRKNGSPTPTSWGMPAAAFVAATALAAGVAYLMGARAAAGVWMVAMVMAFCCVASVMLGARANGVSHAS